MYGQKGIFQDVWYDAFKLKVLYPYCSLVAPQDDAIGAPVLKLDTN